MSRTGWLVIVYGFLFALALLLHFSFPFYPFADLDTASYLSPALSLLSNAAFTHESARSFLYPLFVAACIWLSGSLKSIIVAQLLIGLTSVAVFAFHLHAFVAAIFPSSRYKMIIADTFCLALISYLVFSSTLFTYIHTIRPELIFLSFGMLLASFGLWYFKNLLLNNQKHYTLIWCLLLFADLFMIVFFPRWIIPGAGLALFIIYKCIFPNGIILTNRIKSVALTLFVFLAAVALPERILTENDPAAKFFGKKHFVFTHYSLIKEDVKAEFGTLDEKEIEFMSMVDSVMGTYDFQAPILGYKIDNIIYHGAADTLQQVILKGDNDRINDFYSTLAIKIVTSHFFGLTCRVGRQISEFFKPITIVDKFPWPNAVNLNRIYSLSHSVLSDMGDQYGGIPAFNDYLQFCATPQASVTPPLFSLLYVYAIPSRLLKYCFPLALLLSLGYLLYVAFKKSPRTKTEKVLAFFTLSLHIIYWAMVLNVALAHSFDNSRYWEALLPFSILMYINSFIIVLSIIPTSVEKRVGLLANNKLLLGGICSGLMFILIVSTGYYATRHYSFDPFVQAPPTRFSLAEKDTNEVRILTIGGSTTANLHLPENQRYPNILQTLLQEEFPDKKITVINAGMEWYTSRHSLINYSSYYYQAKPDVVIIMHAINDLYRSFSPRGFSSGEYDSLYTHFPGPAINGTNPPTLFRYITQHSLFGDIPRKMMSFEVQEYPLSHFQSLSAYSNNISRLINICKADDAEVFIVEQPCLYQQDMPEETAARCWFHINFCNKKVSTLKYEYPSLSSMNKAMTAFNKASEQASIDTSCSYINTTDLIPKTMDYFVDDVHYSATGSEALAKIINTQVMQAKVFKTDTSKLTLPPKTAEGMPQP